MVHIPRGAIHEEDPFSDAMAYESPSLMPAAFPDARGYESPTVAPSAFPDEPPPAYSEWAGPDPFGDDNEVPSMPRGGDGRGMSKGGSSQPRSNFGENPFTGSTAQGHGDRFGRHQSRGSTIQKGEGSGSASKSLTSQSHSQLLGAPNRMSKPPVRIGGAYDDYRIDWQQPTHPPCKTFTSFRKLPEKLRLKIWAYTFPPARKIQVHPFRMKGIKHLLYAPHFKPVALNVCMESRTHALQTYKPPFANPYSKKQVFFDPNRDQLDMPQFYSEHLPLLMFSNDIKDMDLAAIKFPSHGMALGGETLSLSNSQ